MGVSQLTMIHGVGATQPLQLKKTLRVRNVARSDRQKTVEQITETAAEVGISVESCHSIL